MSLAHVPVEQLAAVHMGGGAGGRSGGSTEDPLCFLCFLCLFPSTSERLSRASDPPSNAASVPRREWRSNSVRVSVSMPSLSMVEASSVSFEGVGVSGVGGNSSPDTRRPCHSVIPGHPSPVDSASGGAQRYTAAWIDSRCWDVRDRPMLAADNPPGTSGVVSQAGAGPPLDRHGDTRCNAPGRSGLFQGSLIREPRTDRGEEWSQAMDASQFDTMTSALGTAITRRRTRHHHHEQSDTRP